MIIFAIESSCDETSAAVLDAGESGIKVLSNIVSSQIATHALYGGVVPEIASRAHCEAVSTVCEEALRAASIAAGDIEAVAVTFAPGLIGSLLVGVSCAKALAYRLGVPLIPVQHIEGHVSAAYIENNSLKPRFTALVVSGGHTSIYDVPDYGTFNEIGSSRDDACGEAFDKVGRVLGLPYPGGAAMDSLAAEGFREYSKDEFIHFPSPAVNDDSFDFSFSGLKTAVINTIHNYTQKIGTDVLPDSYRRLVAASFTKAVCDGITKKLRPALTSQGSKTLVMAGGVAANSHLRNAVGEMCRHMKIDFVVPSMRLCGDNAAMIGARGYHSYLCGFVGGYDLDAYASDEMAEEYLSRIKNKI